MIFDFTSEHSVLNARAAAALEREGRLFAEAAATLGKNDAEIF